MQNIKRNVSCSYKKNVKNLARASALNHKKSVYKLFDVN